MIHKCFILSALVALLLKPAVEAQQPAPKPPAATPPANTPPATTPTANTPSSTNAQPPNTPSQPGATPSAATQPGAPNPAVQKAVDALNRGELQDAIKILEKARESDPLMKPPLVFLAELMYQNGQGNAARRFIEQAAIEDKTNPDVFITNAMFAMGEGRATEAMLNLEKANVYASEPRFSPEQRKRFYKNIRSGLAQIYTQRLDLDNAFAQMNLLLSDDPGNAEARIGLARLLFLRNQTDAAFEELKKAWNDDPNNKAIQLPEINMARFWDTKPGNKDDRSKHKTEAENWFRKALEAYPRDFRAPREFARWLLAQGRLADADKQLDSARSLNPADNEVNALTGLAHRYRKNFVEAQKIFDSLDRTERGNVFYQWNLALSMAESQDKTVQQQGVVVAQQVQAQQNFQNNPEALAVLGWCLYKVGRLDDAETALKEAIRIASNQASPDTRYYFARVLVDRGREVEARDLLKSAVEMDAAFVYRPDATELLRQLNEKHPPKAEDKKP